jgi:hypothetical protein
MPLLVYLLGAAAGTERLERSALANMALVVAGVVVASYGGRRRLGEGAACCCQGAPGHCAALDCGRRLPATLCYGASRAARDGVRPSKSAAT